MSKKIYELTQEGVDKLRAELEDLKNNQRPTNLQALKEAREQGDLSENADYDAAREEQSKIETRVGEIDNILKNHKILKASTSDEVEIGKKVKIKYLENDKIKEFRLVGTIETNPKEGKISTESVVGRSLLGHYKGDEVSIKTPNNRTYTIMIMEVSNDLA